MTWVGRTCRAICVITIEDAVQTVECDAWSIILDRDNRLVAVWLQPNQHASTGGRKAERIVHDGFQDRLQRFRLPHDKYPVGNMGIQPHLAHGVHRLVAVHEGSGESRKINLRELRFQEFRGSTVKVSRRLN